MSGPLQACFALGLALGVHLALFLVQPGPAGAVSSGSGGEALIHLDPLEGDLAALVASWEAPPLAEIAPPPELAQPPDATEMPALPQMDVAAARPPLTSAPAQVAPPDMAEAPQPLPQLDPPPELPAVAEPAPLPAVADVNASDVLPAASMPRPKARPDRPLAAPDPSPGPAPAAKTKVAKPPKASAPAQPSQKAAGTGGGSAAGSGGSAKVATLSKSQITSLKSGWGADIRARIERKKAYPRAAKGASGKVTVRLTVNRAGQLTGVAVAQSSGNAALDQAAVKAVKSAGRFPAAPKGLNEASYSFTLPMSFSR